MPIYDLECPKCGTREDVSGKYEEVKGSLCKCGAPRVIKIGKTRTMWDRPFWTGSGGANTAQWESLTGQKNEGRNR